MLASLHSLPCLKFATITTVVVRCFAHDASIPRACRNTEPCSFYPGPLQFDSGSFVQIAVLSNKTDLVVKGTNFSRPDEPSMLTINVLPLHVDQRLIPAIFFVIGLILSGFLLQWFSSQECPQDDTSGRIRETENTSSGIILLANIWPNIILAGVSFGMMAPLLPYVSLNFFAQNYTHLPLDQIRCDLTTDAGYCKKAVNDSVWWTSFLSALSAAVSIGLGPAIGALSDALGRKTVIIGCEILKLVPSVALSLFVFYDVSLYAWYALSVFSFIPVFGVWFALITDLIVDPDRRATTFGLCLIVWEVSILVGMCIAACLSLKAATATSMILQFGYLFYIFVWMKETLPEDLRAPLKRESLAPVVGLSILTRNSSMLRLCAIFMISEFVTSGLDKIGISYFQKYLAFNADDSYKNGILGQVSVLGWIGCLMHQMIVLTGEVGLLFIAQGSGALFNVSLFFAASTSQVFALQGALSGAVALIFPATAALKGSMVTASEQGHLQGAVQGVKSLASCLGPVFLGCMFNRFDGIADANGWQWARLIFAVGALLHGLTIPVIATMPRDILQKMSAMEEQDT